LKEQNALLGGLKQRDQLISLTLKELPFYNFPYSKKYKLTMIDPTI
jgi:hypothetical protein